MRARRRDSVTPASAAGSILREEVQMDPPEQYQAASRRAVLQHHRMFPRPGMHYVLAVL